MATIARAANEKIILRVGRVNHSSYSWHAIVRAASRVMRRDGGFRALYPNVIVTCIHGERCGERARACDNQIKNTDGRHRRFSKPPARVGVRAYLPTRIRIFVYSIYKYIYYTYVYIMCVCMCVCVFVLIHDAKKHVPFSVRTGRDRERERDRDRVREREGYCCCCSSNRSLGCNRGDTITISAVRPAHLT